MDWADAERAQRSATAMRRMSQMLPLTTLIEYAGEYCIPYWTAHQGILEDMAAKGVTAEDPAITLDDKDGNTGSDRALLVLLGRIKEPGHDTDLTPIEKLRV